MESPIINFNNTFDDELIHKTDEKTDDRKDNKNNEQSILDKNIINMSKYFWNKIKKKERIDYCHFNFPLILIKNIDGIENIYAHIRFCRSGNHVEGLFYIHNIHSIGHVSFNHDDSNSFYVNKNLYFTYIFYKTKMDCIHTKLKKNNVMNNKYKFHNFNNSIKSLFRNIIFKLKFDNFFGKFFIPNNEESNYLTSLFCVIESSDNMKSIGDTCCVCHEKTATQTKCNHNLCVKCYSKIKKNNGENSTCPLCRKYI